MRITLRLGSIAAAMALVAGCSKPAPEMASAPTAPVAPVAGEKAPAPTATTPAAPATAPVMKGRTLTEKSIQDCLDTIKDPKIEAAVTKYREEAKGNPNGLQAGLAGLGADKELEGIVQKHGFADWQDWAATTAKLFIGASKAGMAQAMSNQKDVPPEQAKAMAQAHENMMKGMADAEKSVGGITDDELKAVEKKLPEIQKLGKKN